VEGVLTQLVARVEAREVELRGGAPVVLQVVVRPGVGVGQPPLLALAG